MPIVLPESSPDAESEGSPTESFTNEAEITQHPLVACTSQSTKSEVKRGQKPGNIWTVASEMFHEIMFMSQVFKRWEVNSHQLS